MGWQKSKNNLGREIMDERDKKIKDLNEALRQLREELEKTKEEKEQIEHEKEQIEKRFVNNLWNRDRENLFRFVIDKDVASTNNISERELRALVIIRKISNGSRSSRGANATALLLSIVPTLRFQKKNILNGLSEILNSPSGY